MLDYIIKKDEAVIIEVTMKTPDALSDAIDEAVRINDEDCMEKEDIERFAKQWFAYGEYVTLELDTEAKTCVVKQR
jgi:hypothetical protein